MEWFPDVVSEVLWSVSLPLLMLMMHSADELFLCVKLMTFTMFCIKRHLQNYLRKLSKENEPLANRLAMIRLACPIVGGLDCSIRK